MKNTHSTHSLFLLRLSYLIYKLFNLHLSLKYDCVIVYVQFQLAFKQKPFKMVFVSTAICAAKLLFISIFIPSGYDLSLPSA